MIASEDIRSVKIGFGVFCLQAVREACDPDPTGISPRVAQAVRLFLERGGLSESPGWTYPSFLVAPDREHPAAEIEVEIEDSVWRAFSEEAERLGVSPSLLARHAILCLAADSDRGGRSALS